MLASHHHWYTVSQILLHFLNCNLLNFNIFTRVCMWFLVLWTLLLVRRAVASGFMRILGERLLSRHPSNVFKRWNYLHLLTWMSEKLCSVRRHCSVMLLMATLHFTFTATVQKYTRLKGVVYAMHIVPKGYWHGCSFCSSNVKQYTVYSLVLLMCTCLAVNIIDTLNNAVIIQLRIVKGVLTNSAPLKEVC